MTKNDNEIRKTKITMLQSRGRLTIYIVLSLISMKIIHFHWKNINYSILQ